MNKLTDTWQKIICNAFLKGTYVFSCQFYCILFLIIQLKTSCHCSNYGLATNKRRPIIWIKHDPDYWRIYVSPVISDFSGWVVIGQVWPASTRFLHYCDVIMGVMASQITSLMIAYSIVHSGAAQRKHQSSVSLAFSVANSPVTSEFPAQMASNAKNVSIWWHHHASSLHTSFEIVAGTLLPWHNLDCRTYQGFHCNVQ